MTTRERLLAQAEESSRQIKKLQEEKMLQMKKETEQKMLESQKRSREILDAHKKDIDTICTSFIANLYNRMG